MAVPSQILFVAKRQHGLKACSCLCAELTSTSSRGSRGKPSAAQQGADSPARRVSGLLDSVDMELLARAAFQCGAHARALLYFESHVRAKEKGTLNPVALTSTTYEDDDVSFFQVGDAAVVVSSEALNSSTACACNSSQIISLLGCSCAAMLHSLGHMHRFIFAGGVSMDGAHTGRKYFAASRLCE